MEVNFEDASDFRENPLEEGGVDVGQETLEGSNNLNQVQGTTIAKEGLGEQVLTTQIQALFSVRSSKLSTV